MSKKSESTPPDAREVAEAVRKACLEAAMRAYEEASISGLCHEGAWECAVGAVRDVDLDAIVAEVMGHDPGNPGDLSHKR